MKNLVLLGVLMSCLVLFFARCDYEGTLTEYPEQVEKPLADTTKVDKEK